MSSTLHFIPFPCNSIRGGYLTWEGARQSTLLLAGQETDFWEVQYPIYGINISCYLAESGSWLLEAATSEAGMAPSIPLLICSYQQGVGLVQTYRYEYPRNYCDSLQLEFFDSEISDILTCFRGIHKYILEPTRSDEAPPIRPGCISLVQGPGGSSEEVSYHLLTSDEVLYIILSLSYDELKSAYSGAIFRGHGKVPIAILSIDFQEMVHSIDPYVGYETSKDFLPCTELALEILKNKAVYSKLT